MSKMKFKLLLIGSLISLLINLSLIFCQTDNFLSPPVKITTQPKDYAYSPQASRVRNLVGFFNKLGDSQSYDVEIRKKQEVLISLSEAASKLHFLIDGQPLDFKCNKYVKLINKPDIRTYSMVSLLANEDKLFNEIEQNDANFISKLINNRNFDSLARLQTILQSLESEKDGKKSNYEPIVQQDLLNCINYFIYRNQRATSGLASFVKEQKKALESELMGQGFLESESTLNKFKILLEQIKSIELNGQNGNHSIHQDDEFHSTTKDGKIWLDKFSKLNQLIEQNQFQIPTLVQKFITDPKRRAKLQSLENVLIECKQLQYKILDIESRLEKASELSDNLEYKQTLIKLANLVESNRELLPHISYLFIHKPSRWLIVEKLKLHDNKQQNKAEVQ